MPKAPLLSIGLPVYNGENFLDACVESILGQTFSDFELIICDNASTDKTQELSQAWCQADERVRVARAPVNKGAAANFNWTFSLARGRYFKWCAADDLLKPEFLGACIAALESDLGAVLAYAGTMDIDEKGNEIGEIYDNNLDHKFYSEDIAERFRDLVCAEHSCITVFGVIRRQALEQSSLIGPYVASDRVLLAELGMQGRFVRTAGNTMLHRQHSKRSVTEMPRLRGRLTWFDPDHKGLSFPSFRLLKEYLRVAFANELPLREKLRCSTHVARWVKWGAWEGLLDDLTYYARIGRKSNS